MKIISVQRIDDTIYELIYKNWLGEIKSTKIFPYLFGWRYCNNGEELSFPSRISVANIAKDLKINEIKRL